MRTYQQNGKLRHASSRRKWWGLALVAVLLLVMGLGALEMAVRVIHPDTILIPSAFRDDAVAGFRYQPELDGIHRTPEYHTRLITNARGLRGAEFAREPQPGVARVLALGDSFTAGVGVEESQSWPRVLERQLDKQGRKVEVINAGVGGWGLDNALSFLIGEGLGYRPKVVVLGLFENDISLAPLSSYLYRLQGEALIPHKSSEPRHSALRRLVRLVPGYGLLAQHSYLLNRLRIGVANHFHNQMRAGGQGDGIAMAGTAAPGQCQVAWGKAGLHPLYQQVIIRLAEVCHRAEVRLVVMVIPSQEQMQKVSRIGSPPPLLEELNRFLDAQKITRLDMVSRLSGRPLSNLYYPQDGHFTPLGQLLAGQALAPVVAPLLESQ